MDAHTDSPHQRDPLQQSRGRRIEPAPGKPATTDPVLLEPAMPRRGPLEIQDPGDCLALLRHTFSSLPRDSLVVVGLLDGATGGHMRIDLAPALREPVSSARLIADCLAGEGSAPAPEAALVVLIGEDDPSPEQDRTWRACLDALRLMLESEYCVRIVQVWFLAGGHIRDPRCPDPQCCSLPGRRVADLRIPLLAPPADAGSGPEAWPLEKTAHRFLDGAPRADPAMVALLKELRADREGSSGSFNGRRVLESWDLALRCQLAAAQNTGLGEAPGDLSEVQGQTQGQAQGPAGAVCAAPGEPRARAAWFNRLLGQLRTSFGRDLLIPLAALGLEHAVLGLEQAQSDPERGSAEDPRLRDYAGSFLGETSSRPDWDRVDALETVLRELVPYAREAERENLLALMAWVEWARGRGTASGSFIDRCLEEFPHNEFSRLIEELMRLKGVCRWARVKQHSWSWGRGARGSRPEQRPE